MDSATQTGLSLPSRSIVTSIVNCEPPAIGSTASSLKRPRSRLPLGTGAGKRTRFRP